MVQTTEHTIFDKWKTTGELLTFLLKQEGLTSLAEAGGPQAVREMLPEEYRDHFDIVQPGLIETLLKPKNRLMGPSSPRPLPAWGRRAMLTSTPAR